jgi:hypothetical protein
MMDGLCGPASQVSFGRRAGPQVRESSSQLHKHDHIPTRQFLCCGCVGGCGSRCAAERLILVLVLGYPRIPGSTRQTRTVPEAILDGLGLARDAIVFGLERFRGSGAGHGARWRR